MEPASFKKKIRAQHIMYMVVEVLHLWLIVTTEKIVLLFLVLLCHLNAHAL